MAEPQNNIERAEILCLPELTNANSEAETGVEMVQFTSSNCELPKHKKSQISGLNWRIALISSNRNELFEKLKIDWILKAFRHPSLVLTDIVFEKAIQREITNPLQLTNYILQNEGVSVRISPKHFYKMVLCSPYIDTTLKLNAIICMLKAVKSPTKFLDNFLEPMYRYLYDEKYKREVDKFIKARKQLNVSWSKERLMREYLELSVEYSGTLKLPESCTLISHRRDLRGEGLKMRHCIIDYWKNVVEKKYFVIHMQEPEPLTFLIANFKRTRYFTFEAVSGVENSPPTHKALTIMGRYLSEESNQQFFRENAQIMDTCLSERSEIQEILNTL
jgi:hypothetical protein